MFNIISDHQKSLYWLSESVHHWFITHIEHTEAVEELSILFERKVHNYLYPNPDYYDD